MKSPVQEPELGIYLAALLDRLPKEDGGGGLAVYGRELPPGWVKISLQHPDPAYDWNGLAWRLGRFAGSLPEVRPVADHAILTVRAAEPAVRAYLSAHTPDVTVLAVASRLKILRAPDPRTSLVEHFEVRKMVGTHALAHSARASADGIVTPAMGPFAAGLDLCFIHNGVLHNPQRLKTRLQRDGMRFRTSDSSEIAAAWLAWTLQQGATIAGALRTALRELQGLQTFVIGTGDCFAVLRDATAGKTGVLAETDDYVALAPEESALAGLPGLERARLWEPEPGTVYSWCRETPAPAEAELASLN